MDERPGAPVGWGIVGCGWVARDHVLPGLLAAPGAHLAGACERELATLPTPLSVRTRALLKCRADAETPVGRAFHAADVLDRVLQVHHHARAAGFTADQALVDLELVHPGPVTPYQHTVLAAAGL